MGICDDDFLFGDDNTPPSEEKLKQFYGADISKFYYSNTSEIYAFDLGERTYYHILELRRYEPIDNLINPVIEKSYVTSFEIDETVPKPVKITYTQEEIHQRWEDYGYIYGCSTNEDLFFFNGAMVMDFENTLNNYYGNITKFHYNNQSVIYAFDKDNQTYYHIFYSRSFEPLTDVNNPIFHKSYLLGYETSNGTYINLTESPKTTTNYIDNFKRPENAETIIINGTEYIRVPTNDVQIIGIIDNTPKFKELKIHILGTENVTATNEGKPFENFTAQLTTNNTTASNLQISVKITRTSNDTSKIYNLTTDENGTINLPINLADGIYNIETYYKDYYKYHENYKLSQDTLKIENNTNRFIVLLIYGHKMFSISNNKDINITYGDKENFTFQVQSLNPLYLENSQIKVEFTRLSDNVKKFYYYTPGTSLINIPINLNPGAYQVSVYLQDNNLKLSTNDILISNPLTNKTETIIKTEEDKSKYYVGTLKTYSGDAISHKTVDINITRQSDNTSKIYSVLTNEDGYFSLPINLGYGEYTIKCSYEGTSKYSSCKCLDKVSYPFSQYREPVY